MQIAAMTAVWADLLNFFEKLLDVIIINVLFIVNTSFIDEILELFI